MATKRSAHRAKRRASHAEPELTGIAGALFDAVIEIGRAAEDLQHSMQHVQKAGTKGKKAIEPIRRTGEKAIKEARRRLSQRSAKKHPKRTAR